MRRPPFSCNGGLVTLVRPCRALVSRDGLVLSKWRTSHRGITKIARSVSSWAPQEGLCLGRGTPLEASAEAVYNVLYATSGRSTNIMRNKALRSCVSCASHPAHALSWERPQSGRQAEVSPAGWLTGRQATKQAHNTGRKW